MINHTLSLLAVIGFIMKRTTLYSRHIEPTPEKPEGDLALPASTQPASAVSAEPPRYQRLKERLIVLTIGILMGGLALYAAKHSGPSQPTLTQEHIDAAVLLTLATKDLPSRAARASAAIAPSVVRIRTDVLSSSGGTQISDNALGVGTGVVIKEDGTILTNLHVVANAPRLIVTFADGMEHKKIRISPF
jgi:hypothetical protein